MSATTSRLLTFVGLLLALGLPARAAVSALPARAQDDRPADRISITPYMVESVSGQPFPAELIRLTTVQLREESLLPDNPEADADSDTDTGRAAEDLTVEVPFLRFPAAAASPEPPIFVLNAGLADARVNRFSVETVLPFVAQFGATSDIVLVGMRGVGQAAPELTCARNFDVPLDAETDPETLAANLGAYFSTCDQFWRDGGAISSAYNAVEIARDVDSVRELLGYETIKLVGADFGSHVALELIRSYGDTIDRALLAALVGPDQMLYLPSGADAVLEALAIRTAADPALNAVMPDFLGTMDAVLTQLAQQPVTLDVLDPATQLEHQVTVGAVDLQYATVAALGTDARWTLPARYYDMSQGDFTWIGETAYAMRTTMNRQLMPVAATCASGASEERSAQVADEAEESLLGNAVNGVRFDICTAVGDPDLGDGFRAPIESDVPVLFVSGTMDPFAQPDEVEQLVDGFENGAHLVVVGGGRNLLAEAQAQLAPIAQDFLVTGAEFTVDEIEISAALAPIVIAPVTDIGWSAGYFNNRSVQGDATVQRVDSAIDFNWGEGSPDPAIAADNFSARWTASRELPAGPYRFSAWSDDGIRVRVDDVLIIDQWEEGGARNFVTDVNLVRGLHNVDVEYFEAEGLALAQLSVAAVTDFPDWKAEYFDNVGLQGNPLVVRNEQTIDLRWAAGATVAGLATDNISARWSRDLALPAGTYQFSVKVAGAVRLWLDGTPLIDDWTFGPLRTLSAQTQPLPGGLHAVRVEYAKTTGPGAIEVTWGPLAQVETPPVADVTGPQRVIVGQTFTLDGSGSTPGGGEQIVSYAWDLGDGAAAAGSTVQHLYAAPGFYNVTLTVTNDRGASDTTSVQIRADGEQATPPPSRPPQAVIVAPAQGMVGEPLLFDASQSTASDPILIYGWQFGDGTSANAVQVAKTYGAPGIYNVVLTITDAAGLTSSATRLVQIFAPTPAPTPDLPPTATPLPPPTPVLPPTATPTFTPLPEQPTPVPPPTATLLPGQPTPVPPEGTPPIDLTPPPDGQITPTPDGEPAAPPQAVIQNIYRGQVLEVQLENGVAVLPDVKIGQIVTLLGTESLPGSYPITSFYWDMQDGGVTSQDGAFPLEFSAPGDYPVSLTVSDEVGLTSTAMQIIRVINEFESD